MPSQAIYFNYGFNRIRFVTPVPVNARIRGAFRVLGVEDRPNGKRTVTFEAKVEIEGQNKPALVAEWLSAWMPNRADRMRTARTT
ncbi:hypothetical protein [Sphingosinicella microcystinivorans]|uniref:Nodulation protein NodN n=1 Tax=Sphingosinicella microcystinivorans TaxID=335406 RepID=A0AAD1FZ48_SPHMI|nr:hypothetical protein [Sphingosinicella microcystinivorans]BBE32368.1 hypothetical protein SmB9_00260 [Sphingosinicella microcystinivorans]